MITTYDMDEGDNGSYDGLDFVSSKSDADKLYLSRFHMKATCDDGHIEEWDEFIEPLTIHTRHPFGFEQCPKGI